MLKDIRTMIFMALLVGLALAISLFESVIPIPFVAPGAKLGLSNIVYWLRLSCSVSPGALLRA